MSFDCFVCFMKKDWEGDDQGGAWIDHAGLGNVRVGCRKFLPVFTRWLSSGYFIPDCYVYKVNDPAFHFSLRQRLVMLFGYAPGGGWDSTAEVTWAKFEYTHKIISGGCYTNEAKLQDFGKKTHLAAAVVIRLAAVDHIWNAKKKRNDAKREKEKTTCRMIHDRLNEAQSEHNKKKKQHEETIKEEPKELARKEKMSRHSPL